MRLYLKQVIQDIIDFSSSIQMSYWDGIGQMSFWGGMFVRRPLVSNFVVNYTLASVNIEQS